MRCKIPANDLVQRLDGTWCMYKGLPVYVRVDGSQLRLYDSYQIKTLIQTIYPDDPDFDISTPPLGYTQVNDMTVVYVTREPRRRYKQGFDTSVMRATLLGTDYGYDISVNSGYMRDTMSRKYPSIPVALKKLKTTKQKLDSFNEANTICVCISNDCAFRMLPTGVIEVWFQQQLVGTLRENVGKKPTVVVPSRQNGWVVSVYLREFDWIVE